MSDHTFIEEMIGDALSAPTLGAAIGIIEQGAVTHAAGYGFAQAESQLAFTPDTQFRICSVTKQFICALVLMAADRDLLRLSDHPRHFLTEMTSYPTSLNLYHLCTNQSGIKDYWTAAMLTGAIAESPFTHDDADRMVDCLADPDFPPGARFAYSNTNFMMLGRVLEKVTGRPLPQLADEWLFAPLGMEDTHLDTTSTGGPLPDDTVGYEPDGCGSYMVAKTNLEWAGDAGIISTLTDLLAWEQVFHQQDHPLHPIVARLQSATSFNDGTASAYRFGLRVSQREGITEVGHTGGLRGWRMAKIHRPDLGHSVIVLLNHVLDPNPIAERILDQLNGTPRGAAAPAPITDPAPQTVQYVDRENDLIFHVTQTATAIDLSCGWRHFQFLKNANGLALDGDQAQGHLHIDQESGVISFHLPQENIRTTLHTLPPPTIEPDGLIGSYHSASLASDALITQTKGGQLFIRFVGPKGSHHAVPLQLVGGNYATFRCDRALDYAAPGEFSVMVDTNPDRQVTGITINAWLARGLRFDKGVC